MLKNKSTFTMEENLMKKLGLLFDALVPCQSPVKTICYLSNKPTLPEFMAA